jgi:peptidoglycan/LPS O-acetylase OafA/YrhL
MRRNPFLDFQRRAERAGYPALLLVSLLCLALVVVPVALLALTQAVWILGLAVLSLGGAVALLAAAIGASFADGGEADPEPPRKPVPRI